MQETISKDKRWIDQLAKIGLMASLIQEISSQQESILIMKLMEGKEIKKY